MRSRHALIATTVLLGLAGPAAAGTPDGDIWIARARSIVRVHHLLPRSVMSCAALLYDGESSPKVASVTAVETHKGRCGGDPNFASRIFTMNIDEVSGHASWDYQTGAMRSIR